MLAERVAGDLEAAGLHRPPRRSRPASGREVRRRRPDRLPDPRHSRQEDAVEDGPADVLEPREPERGTRPVGTAGGGRQGALGDPAVTPRRRFSEKPFGEALTQLMGEQASPIAGWPRATDLSAGYLNHIVHGNRPGSLRRGRSQRSPRRSASSRSTSASTASGSSRRSSRRCRSSSTVCTVACRNSATLSSLDCRWP